MSWYQVIVLVAAIFAAAEHIVSRMEKSLENLAFDIGQMEESLRSVERTVERIETKVSPKKTDWDSYP